MTTIKNIAIIAHVDHGKTTLVDEFLKQSGAFRENQQVSERAMDSNDIERERGITILAKCTSLEWQGTRINIVDTPGHADFGGEVERILTMVDGVIVLVDAAEGPMPQTKFVLSKALSLGLRPIVVINKVDRPDRRCDEVLDEIFDLFVMLEATDEQLDFPVLYAAGRDGWAARSLEDPRENLNPLFEEIVKYVPSPKADPNQPFRMLATILEVDPYVGKILTGRIESGSIKVNAPVKVLKNDGTVVEQGRLSKILAYRHLGRESIDTAIAGDIVSIAGLQDATVSHTICAPEVEEALQARPIDPSTLTMTFSVNDSPLAGLEGDKVTSRLIRDRLMKERESNITIDVKDTQNSDAFEVSARGELQLSVLIENMRREGFELTISKPRVIYKTDEETGKRLEPLEEVIVDVDEEYSGVVIEKISLRKGEMTEMRPSGGKTRLYFIAPSRGLIGYHGEFLTDTRGTGVMSRLFHSYGPYRGSVEGRRNGVLLSTGSGKAVPYALFNLEDRGVMLIDAGTAVYEGMIIGEHNRPNDLSVNPLKGKQLSNVRASGKDEAVKLTPPKILALEEAISYIDNDEQVEVTPKSIRLRKTLLDPNARKRAERSK
ncbi:MAG: translational GTPase TypA [bacterium]|nr:translational GTPase TypA [bacterium]